MLCPKCHIDMSVDRADNDPEGGRRLIFVCRSCGGQVQQRISPAVPDSHKSIG